MIGERKAGAFVASEIGRSGGERRDWKERRHATKPVALDLRATGERRLVPDRRLGDDGVDLRSRVMIDERTGLFSRGFFEAALKRELARCRRHGAMASLVLIDVDDFKATNDRWGEGAGDAALRATAAVVGRHLRATDVACRYGGDEFAIILPDTYRSGALFVAERILAEVRRSFERGVDGCRVALTVSVGVAWYGAMCSTLGEFLEAADRALDAAKAAGGDRVEEAL